jgi:hypothetical protein
MGLSHLTIYVRSEMEKMLKLKFSQKNISLEIWFFLLYFISMIKNQLKINNHCLCNMS